MAPVWCSQTESKDAGTSDPEILRLLLKVYVYGCFPAHMYVHHMLCLVSVGYLGLELQTARCDPTSGCWDSNPGSLEEQ